MENEIYSNIKDRMIKTVEHYNHEVAIIRTGRASADVLDSVKVDYYGTMSPLKNIAHVSVPEAQSILIQPFDPSSLEAIEKAIVTSDLGLSPNNDGNLIRLNIPALTEERRKDLVRVVHKTIEEGRIGIRNLRREANEQLKELEKNNEISEDNLKRALDNIQELTDDFISKLNTVQDNKEKEILS
ncbi:MAG: ribosome recycling factor [Candidatus Marinimicrobia bacterium]|nr:ribosome recycling factor [Candidatus Neomarinimicrobiota bacterium]|tara:strand:+ start:329 stop:883 length:555 start_codon:yes stop_codon:yes gene_type:complete